MNDEFDILVTFNNEKLLFSGKLLNYGFSYKIEVDVKGTKVLFEPDEERNWRALISYDDMARHKNISTSLLSEIALAITEIVK